MGKAESKYVLIRDGSEGECESGQVHVHVHVTPEPEANQSEPEENSRATMPVDNSSIVKMPLTVVLPEEEGKCMENKKVAFTTKGVQTSETDTDSNNQPVETMQELKCGVTVSGLEKQEWSFTLYDFEGRGRVTKEDLARLMKSLYHSVGASLSSPSQGTKTLNLRLTVSPDVSAIENFPSVPKLHSQRRTPHEHKHQRRKQHRSPSKQHAEGTMDTGTSGLKPSAEHKGPVAALQEEHKLNNLATDSSESPRLRQHGKPRSHSKEGATPDAKYSNHRRPKSAHKRVVKPSPLQPTENLAGAGGSPSKEPSTAAGDLAAQLLNLDVTLEQSLVEGPAARGVEGLEGSPAGEHMLHRTTEKGQRKQKLRHRHKHREDQHDHLAAGEAGSPTKAMHTSTSTEQEQIKQRLRCHALKSRKSRPVSMPVDAGWVMGAPGSPGAPDAAALLQRHEHHHIHEHHHHHHHYHWYQT